MSKTDPKSPLSPTSSLSDSSKVRELSKKREIQRLTPSEMISSTESIETIKSNPPLTDRIAVDLIPALEPVPPLNSSSVSSPIPSMEEGWNQLKQIILDVKADQLTPNVDRHRVYELALTSAFHLPSHHVETMIPQLKQLIQTQPDLKHFLDLHLGPEEIETGSDQPKSS